MTTSDRTTPTFLTHLLGKTLKEAEGLLRQMNYTSRLVRDGDAAYIVTSDLHMNRVNLALDNGKVSAAWPG